MLIVGLSTQALPTDTFTGAAASIPKYTYNSATGALTLNWGEFDNWNSWGNDVINTAVKSAGCR